MKHQKLHSRDHGFIGIRTSGNLISSEKIEQISDWRLDRTVSQSYSYQDGRNIRDQIAVSYRIGQELWNTYASIDSANFTQSRDFVSTILQKMLDYDEVNVPTVPKAIESHTYNIALELNNGCIPVVVAPTSTDKNKDSFDVAYREFGDTNGRRAKRRPDTVLQEYLNANDDTLWGIAFAGECFRLMRDNASFTRPTFIEFNLKVIFENSAFSDFSTMWLMLHSSRFNKTTDSKDTCWLEKWRLEGIRAGTVIRERLRGNFERALLAFGNGFLHSNPTIVEKLDRDDLSLDDYLEQLIRLVYRLIFIVVTEERGFIHPPSTKTSIRQLYKNNYGFSQLRDRALKGSMRNDNLDIWEGVRILLFALDNGEERLGIPPLGGLFDQELTPVLNTATISNKHFLEGIYYLSYVEDRDTRNRINWRDMATEELGSVYEGLLDLAPLRLNSGRTFAFENSKKKYGSKRRSAGAYYTPDVLVQALLDSSLDPVLDSAENKGGLKELLKLNIIDPACGSGHFLLGAARRIADRVTKLRDAETLNYQRALRDVIRNCIYGVDKDRLTVELAKAALWIEAIEPGRPLGYLDANIKCGDSTIGIRKLETLLTGIPDDAYASDKKQNAQLLSQFRHKNKSERVGQGVLDLDRGDNWVPRPPNIASKLSTIRNLPEDTKGDTTRKGNAYRNFKNDSETRRWKNASNLYLSPFFLSIESSISGPIPTTGDVWRTLNEDLINNKMICVANASGEKLNAFHWFLEFPDIFSQGGFDAVIGNPPWEKLTILEREFFHLYPEIAEEANAQNRKTEIKNLLADDPIVETKWTQETIKFKGTRNFIRNSNQFPLTAIGELNLYSLFTELSLSIAKPNSWVGLILKSTIFTGSTFSRLTKFVVSNGLLRSVYDFKNEQFFKDVSQAERFSLATFGPSDVKTRLIVGVGLNQANNLSRSNQVTSIDRTFPIIANPQTGTLPQCETFDDLQSLIRVTNSYPTLDESDWKIRYTSGLHMTGQARELCKQETLEAQGYKLTSNHYHQDGRTYIPLYEGKNIHQYDHRFGTFDKVPEERRYKIKASPRNPDISEKQRRNFEIIPRYWVSEDFYILDNQKRKIGSEWNFAFRDVVNVSTNFRTAVGCIVGKVSCNCRAPNIVIDGGNAKGTALFLSMFNSVPYDYLLRQKYYGSRFSKSILIQSFVVDRSFLEPYKKEILMRVSRLSGTSESIDSFVDQLNVGIHGQFCLETRLHDKAWLDALYFHLYKFRLHEIDYVFGTFPIWQNKSISQWGKFYELDLTKEYYKSAF